MYDRERQGKIAHRPLVARLLGKPDSELGVSNYNLGQSRLGDDGVSQYSVDPTTAEKCFDVLLDKLIKQGLPGILRLSHALRKQDADLSNHVTLEEFEAVLKDLRLQFSPEDVKNMFRYLESPKRLDFMDYSLLIKDLTAGMSESRRCQVRETFDRLDYSDSLLDLKQLKPIFNARNYLDVKNGRTHAEDVMNDFFACVDLYVDAQRDRDSHVNAEQFLEFWEHISPAIQTDAVFESLVKHCFRFNELPRKNKLETPEHGKVAVSPIYDKERYHPYRQHAVHDVPRQQEGN
jgi:Ca2+-binding EF-hand superfamily protein